ncbi:hypothetical protein K5549_007344 [Capra hircus]|nr:hypothetical protein K5549_007344 [Capra hircus]
MTAQNCSAATDFTFLGLSDRRHLQQELFVLFLLVYGITVVASVGMILLIKVDPRLHTPMYHFLSNLSFCDVCYSSAVSPKMLADLLSEHKRIPFDLCAMQMYFWGTFADVECLMLAVMAYDHYVAICNPLLYTVSMSRRLCTQLISVVYVEGLVDSAIHTCCTFCLSFCSSDAINHFFCDFRALLALSSSDTPINGIMLFISSSCVMGTSIITVLLSYSYIIGRCKAFSMCASHLTAVAIFHGLPLFMYFRPSSIVIPMLNPLIYSLRNKDVKVAIKKVISAKLCCE